MRLRRRKKQGITVCPVCDVFAWGTTAPAGTELLTLRGENSAQNALRRAKVNGLKPSSPYTEFMPKAKMTLPAPNLWVDPAQPTIQTALTGLFQAIAGHAGAGDFICRDLTPAGFAGMEMNFENPMFGKKYDGMGYTEALRLAFLKKNHCDPIDITSPTLGMGASRANVSVENFDNAGDSEISGQWNQFRAAALQTALHSLIDPLLKSSGDKKPGAFLEQSMMGDLLTWFDIVNDPKTTFGIANPFGIAPPAPTGDGAAAAPAPTSGVLFLAKQAPYDMPKELAGADWRDVMLKSLTALLPGVRKWDGIVIEE